jgi:hypothetical protein
MFGIHRPYESKPRRDASAWLAHPCFTRKHVGGGVGVELQAREMADDKFLTIMT